MKSQIISTFIILNFLACISGLMSKESVPVLIWSDQRKPLDVPAISAIPIPFSVVEGKLLKTFNEKNIILFLQDELSIEDLAPNVEVFKNVNESMENGHSLYIPAMEVGISLPHFFALRGYNVITLEPGSSVGELKLKKDAQNLVVVKLPTTNTNPSRKNSLQKTDEVIKNVLSKVGKANYTVMYTGIRPSIKLESRIEHHRAIREAPYSASDDPHYHKADCALLYLKNDILVETQNNKSYYLLNNHTYDHHSDCHNNNFIQIRYRNLYEFTMVKLKIFFQRFARHWAVTSAELTETTSDGDKVVPLFAQWQMEYVPLNKSWACGKKLVFLSTNLTSNTKTEETLVTMTMKGVQMEAYTHNQTRFSDAWDCVGFFTIPIWMGLFAALILTLILIFGMLMLSDIKTMDRFDDPKGKHFMIAGTAE